MKSQLDIKIAQAKAEIENIKATTELYKKEFQALADDVNQTNEEFRQCTKLFVENKKAISDINSDVIKKADSALNLEVLGALLNQSFSTHEVTISENFSEKKIKRNL